VTRTTNLEPRSTTIHLIGICGTAMATLAALLKRRGYDVRGSDQNVYPPMSDFLARERIPTLTGYAPDHITARLDLVVVGNAISRGNPSSRACSSARSDTARCRRRSRSLPVGRAVDRHRRHARQDDDDLVDRLAADARRLDPTCSSAASR
jgi:UDP-N-acetylmuramate-alanine ligase